MPALLPKTLDAALDMLASRPDATVLAGGTDLMVDVNEGRRRPHNVVAIDRIPELRGVRAVDGELIVGAATTYTELCGEATRAAAPALAQAARTVGSPQIRNTGTIGGNLVTASPAGDTLPVLAAMGASVVVASATRSRTMPVDRFLVGPKRTALAADELVLEVRIPLHRGPQEFLKVGVRNAMVIAVASLALAVDLDRRSVGIALGSVGPTVLRATDACAAAALHFRWSNDGVRVDDPSVLDDVSATVAAAARPIDDHRSTAAYRRHAVQVLARRALRRAVTPT
jgi:CO/xanthine dehydrogenase FAD-binding subunit